MKRYRMGISAVLLYAILAAQVPVFAQQADSVYSVYVNGVVMSGAHPLLRDGIAYLPVNSLAQALGVSIQWDARLNVVKVNDEVISARPLNENGSLLLPVEAVAQAMSGSVEWDGRNHAIRISSRPSVGGTAVATARPTVIRPVAPPTSTSSTPSTSTITTTVPITTPPVVVATPSATSGVYGSTTTSQYPSPSAYPPSTSATSPTPYQPINAPPRMPSSLQLPPAGTENGPAIEGATPYASSTGTGVYVPKSTQNNVFAVTVTNVEALSSIKDFYHPRSGYRFVVVYLSQQNVSNEVQIYTGRFSVLDQNNRSYDYIEGLSNFWLVILRPYGINFGYLVFEMPSDAQPTRLALHALNQSPLTLNL